MNRLLLLKGFSFLATYLELNVINLVPTFKIGATLNSNKIN